MQRLLRTASILSLVLGGALWFFGGMNTGPSQWTEEAHAADEAHAVASERRNVFRPGPGILAGAAALAIGLWGAAALTRR